MTRTLSSAELHLEAASVGNDTIEVVDEIDRIVYVFLATASTTAEQLVEDWAASGDPTWSITRPATDDDLATASAALETTV